LLKTVAVQAENRIASLALGGIMILPLAEIASRRLLHQTIPGETAFVSTLTLWLGLLGAAIAARDGKLLTLATGEFLPEGRVAATAHVIAGAVGATNAIILCLGGVALLRSDRAAGDMLGGGVPVWVADLALPIGFGLIAGRLAWRASPHRRGRLLASLGIVAGVLTNLCRASLAGMSFAPWLAIVSQKASIEDLFVGGLVPGLLMLGLLAAWGVREGLVTRAGRTPFHSREAFAALWEAKWELMLPVFVVGMFVGGVATLVESAPMAALYTVIVQRYIHRDLPTWKDVFRVSADCIALVGGVLLILAVAAGLTDYLVFAEIPARLVAWTQAHVQSRLVFLLFLNVFLLAVGTLMDIFSAIVVVVPLILPLAEIYGLNYVHLGIIFVANLELVFLHPPLGLNLLLASVRFKKPVLEVTWATLPMLGILAVGVLLITYVPWLTLGLLHWMGRV